MEFLCPSLVQPHGPEYVHGSTICSHTFKNQKHGLLGMLYFEMGLHNRNLQRASKSQEFRTNFLEQNGCFYKFQGGSFVVRYERM